MFNRIPDGVIMPQYFHVAHPNLYLSLQKYRNFFGKSKFSFSFGNRLLHYFMIISRSIKDLQEIISSLKKINKSIGFVPTMGALHQGHVSLVKIANKMADISVVSIFVNPTQFNEKSDLDNYPRTEKEDCDLLETNHCDIVFIPTVEEIYQKDILLKADYGNLTNVLEGAKRPGHFDGVVTIVNRLFEIVKPDIAIFGEKDFQQLAILREMTARKNLDITIVGAPIIREKNGLAMSSRNRLLSDVAMDTALILSKTLQWCVENKNKYSAIELQNLATEKLKGIPDLRLEYLNIVDSNTFEQVTDFENHDHTRVLVAAYVGDIRLIDNIELT